MTEHGVISAYTNHACRCEACREAWAIYQRGYHARIRAESWAYRQSRADLVAISEAALKLHAALERQVWGRLTLGDVDLVVSVED